MLHSRSKRDGRQVTNYPLNYFLGNCENKLKRLEYYTFDMSNNLKMSLDIVLQKVVFEYCSDTQKMTGL